jgi:disulfide oxidoreductase YuzD
MKEEIKTTIKKNQTADIPTKNGGKYSYKYVDIAQIHNYLEENNMSYYQYIERIDNDDYIMTVKIINGEEKQALRGSRVVDATLYGNDNPAQKQGSALTYARRYSLLMAFGLATEDDDTQSLNKTIEKKEVKATEKQIELLESLLTDEEFEKTQEKYGINLEKLDIKMASKIISSKKGNN